jgi:hypothetical protein
LHKLTTATLASITLLAATSPAYASWTISTVVDNDATNIASAYWVMPDYDVQVHRIVYRDGDTHELMMASSSNSSGTWSSWTLSSVAAYTNSTPAIMIDKYSGTTFVAFEDADGDLMIAYKPLCILGPCADWERVTIDSGTTRGQYPSLTLLYDGEELDSIHTASIEGSGSSAQVRHSYCDTWPNCESTSDWTAEDAPFGKPGPYKTAIQSYIDSAGTRIVRLFATMDHVTNNTNGVSMATWVSLAGLGFGSSGSTNLTSHRGHITFKKHDSGIQLTIATGTNVYFNTVINSGAHPWQRVSADGQGGGYADPVFDEFGVHTVAFNRDTDDDVIVGRRLADGTWERESIPDSGSVGRYISVFEDLEGDLMVVYRDGTEQSIKIARGD